MALAQKDFDNLKSLTSKEYFEIIKKNKFLKKTSIKDLKLDDENNLIFDMTYKKGAMTKDLIFVNIKDSSKKEYGDHWYLVKKMKGKYLITDMQFQD